MSANSYYTKHNIKGANFKKGFKFVIFLIICIIESQIILVIDRLIVLWVNIYINLPTDSVQYLKLN